MRIETIASQPVAMIPADGPALSSEQDALDIVGGLYGTGAELVVIPVARFAPEAWRLETRLLGHFVQKLVNYSVRLAIVGDLTAEIARSGALADFVRESNRGGTLGFFVDEAALRDRLGAATNITKS